MKEIIDAFVEQYKIEYDYFSNLSKKVRDICDRELQIRGIKAITSWRAKNPDSLKLKLIKRDKEKHYTSVLDIRNDISDLSGVRIALYFPSEREAVDKVINDMFIIRNKKIFPEESKKPIFDKRFSGYRAAHYRVLMKPCKEDIRYSDHIVEIQVASVLMHSWSEIEHDLIYKPSNGNLSNEEFQILDEINGLVLVGEIALERLQNTMIDRINKKSKFDDSYELKNYLSKYIDNINSKEIGNIKYLNEIMNNMNYNSRNKINKIVSELKYYPDATIAEELIDRIIVETFKTEKDLSKILNNINKNKGNMSGFECFLKIWILLENINQYMNKSYNKNEDKPYGFRFEIYIETKVLSSNEVLQLKKYRNIRNELLHGIGMYEDDYLLENFDSLKNIVLKIINSLNDAQVKEAYIKEFNNIVKPQT